MIKKQNQKLTNTQSKLLKIICYYMGISPSKTVYLTLEFLCSELEITDRQLRTVRKDISHIFDSKWRKATKIDGIMRKNVYVFKVVQNNLGKTSELESPKLPTSNKEEKNLNKNIDLKSKFFNFKNSYSKAKTLSEMIPSIDNKICDELRSKSGRPFSNNFITQLVLKMSKNPKVKATFNYLKGFIAYMVKVLQYEKHDAVKTENIDFKFKINITTASDNKHAKTKVFNETEIRAYDLENRTTDGFKSITDALDKWMGKLV
jgi:hypothetical protein